MTQTGLNIRAARKRRSMTAAELAVKLGCSKRAVFSYENGERNLTVDMLVKIAIALDCDLQTLLHGIDPRNPTEGTVEYGILTPEEHAVFHRMATEWTGDKHALIIFIALYMSLPPHYRREAPLSLIAQVHLALANGDIDVSDLPSGMDYLEEKLELLFK